MVSSGILSGPIVEIKITTQNMTGQCEARSELSRNSENIVNMCPTFTDAGKSVTILMPTRRRHAILI